MKTIVVSTMLFLTTLATGARAQDADHISWRILGTDPDIYAPVFPQPYGQDYFVRTQTGGAHFLHPAFAAPFDEIRRSERQEDMRRVDRAGLSGPFALAMFVPTS